MKIQIFLNARGQVIATARPGPSSGGVHAVLVPACEHTIHEIDVPDHYENLSATELHEKVGAMIVGSRTPPGGGSRY